MLFAFACTFILFSLLILDKKRKNTYDWNHGFLIGSVFMFFTMVGVMLTIIGMCSQRPSPKAIDVYRGKTILEITYRDSVPVDTIVVWKNKQ